MKRIPEFEGLRGFLAWWVFVSHVLLISGFSPDELSQGIRLLAKGPYAVDVFMILSGFVIMSLIYHKKQSYWVFITQRFFRIYPIFLITFLIAILIHPLTTGIKSSLPWDPTPFELQEFVTWEYVKDYYWAHIGTHLTLFHGAVPNAILPASSIAFLDPAWSISLEWQFYLIAPLLFYICTLNRWWVFLIFSFVVIFCHWYLRPLLQSHFILNSFLLQSLFFFWVGIGSFWVWQFMLTELNKFGSIPVLGVVVLCPLLLPLTLSIPLFIWGVAFFASLSNQMNSRHSIANWISSILCTKFFQNMGKVSYSIYLSHMLWLWSFRWLAYEYHWISSRIEFMCYSFVICAVLTYVSAKILYRFIEKPGILLGRRLTERMSH